MPRRVVVVTLPQGLVDLGMVNSIAAMTAVLAGLLAEKTR